MTMLTRSAAYRGCTYIQTVPVKTLYPGTDRVCFECTAIGSDLASYRIRWLPDPAYVAGLRAGYLIALDGDRTPLEAAELDYLRSKYGLAMLTIDDAHACNWAEPFEIVRVV